MGPAQAPFKRGDKWRTPPQCAIWALVCWLLLRPGARLLRLIGISAVRLILGRARLGGAGAVRRLGTWRTLGTRLAGRAGLPGHIGLARHIGLAGGSAFSRGRGLAG